MTSHGYWICACGLRLSLYLVALSSWHLMAPSPGFAAVRDCAERACELLVFLFSRLATPLLHFCLGSDPHLIAAGPRR
ncbi:hypothetical protein FA95DRAFT_331043 [Auriscalpium vulgare]|uniref:Uncharacterized protein n=1 Tax=Auriscalpium vulgare TaxID=40419 RepID=A0ACB8RJ94_9AGAM|nr:hypothetical protein FA95DRAFT_331043 [Auriscalpium vulgare]